MPPLGRVEHVNRFAVVTAGYTRAASRAVDRASQDGVKHARSAQTRYRIGGILGRTQLVKARTVGNRIVGGFRNPDFRWVFFEWGTLKRRRKALKRPRRRNVRRGGIHPQYALTRARQVAVRSLPGHLKSEMSKVR